MQQTFPDIENLIAFRQELHQHPELSGLEEGTAKRIVKQLEQYKPDQILTGLGGTGVAAVYNGMLPGGNTVMFRAELDALPIQDINDMPYSSTLAGVSHKCGHDGHMAILLGLAALLHREKPRTGRVILLFQPAEETGQGAMAVLQDNRFCTLKPDYVFALHNLPGYPAHQVVVRNGSFAAASTGMIIELNGRSSHAAEPENGLNPGQAMAELILELNQLITRKELFQDLTLLTIIHARLGEIAFGTNPGFATIMATLRSYQQANLDLLKTLASDAAAQVADKYGLGYSVRFVEEFPATVNYKQAVELVKQAAEKLKLDTLEAVHPFKWSEDFGHFTAKYKGALLGLGAGLEQAQLHHAHYDFPDTIIPTGANLFYTLATNILNP